MNPSLNICTLFKSSAVTSISISGIDNLSIFPKDYKVYSPINITHLFNESDNDTNKFTLFLEKEITINFNEDVIKLYFTQVMLDNYPVFTYSDIKNIHMNSSLTLKLSNFFTISGNFKKGIYLNDKFSNTTILLNTLITELFTKDFIKLFFREGVTKSMNNFVFSTRFNFQNF